MGIIYKRRLNSHEKQSSFNVCLDNFVLYYYCYFDLVFAVALRQESVGSEFSFNFDFDFVLVFAAVFLTAAVKTLKIFSCIE